MDCVQIVIFTFLAEGGGGVCQIGHYLQYIYLLFFALDIIVFFRERVWLFLICKLGWILMSQIFAPLR